MTDAHGSTEAFGSLRGRPIEDVVAFDGTALHVEDAGAGPTIVFAHGFCLDLTSWHYQIRDLAGDFRLVLYDARGHGRSPAPESGEWSMDALARDLDTVIAAAAADPVVLVGHSMGGMTLMRYAEMFPERLGKHVSALVLVDTTAENVVGGMLPGAAQAARPALRLLEEAAIRAASSNTERFDRIRQSRSDLVSLMVKLMGFGPKAPAAELAFVGGLLSAVPAEVLVVVLQTLREMNVARALDQIDVPTLVISGSRDRITPPAAAERIANAIHGAEFVVIRGAGHMPMLEKPDLFNAKLRAFLSAPGAAYGGRRLGSLMSPD